jgi:hypothetical protein
MGYTFNLQNIGFAHISYLLENLVPFEVLLVLHNFVVVTPSNI